MFRYGDDVQARRGPEDAAQQARRPGKPIEGARLLLQLLRRRWWIIAAAVLGCVAGVVTAKTIAPRVFESRTAIVWEPREVADVRDLRTRIDSVTLPTSLEQVRSRLGLDVRIDDLGERIELLWDGSSNLVTVKTTAAKAEEAKRLADTVVDVFLEHQRDLERTRREEDVQVLRGDLERARTSLDEARSEYDAFRSEHGITDLPVQRQQAIEQAASLRMQADMAEADIRPGRGGGSATSGTVASSGSPRLREARRELARERARFSDQHPKIQALEAEVQALESSDKAGGERAVEARRRNIEEREARFEKISEQARTRLQELSEVEGQASRLLASVRVAESHLSDVQSELTQARDAAKNPKSGFRVVAPAFAPDEPVTSWRKPAAIAIPIAAVLLVVLLILVNEIRGLRVHTASEVAYWGRGAVVGSSNWPKDPTALNPFIDELGDDAVRANGRTLVLASTDDETDAAQQLASRLELVAALRESEPWPGRDDDPWAFDDEEMGSNVHTTPYPQESQYDRDGGLEEGWFRQDGPSGPARASREPGTALATRMEYGRTSFAPGEGLAPRDDHASVELYVGIEEGHELRRATRRADRVLVVVTSGRASAPHIMRVRARLGRDDDGVAFVVIGLPDHLMSLPDRAGPVSSFWTTRRV